MIFTNSFMSKVEAKIKLLFYQPAIDIILNLFEEISLVRT
jgi:hypothetical protein